MTGVGQRDEVRVVVDGAELHTYVWPGTGTPFLLVHGLASNALMWQGVAAELAARGHRVAAVDLRGHGRSSSPPSGYDFATVVADLVAVMASLQLDRPVAAGQSWGGNVVLELAARHPDRVRGIACLDGGWIRLQDRLPDWDEAVARLRPPPTEGLEAAAVERRVRAMHPDWPEAGIQGMLANWEVRDDGTVRPRLDLDRHLQILRHLWEHDPPARYPEVTVPVLLIPASSETSEGSDDRGTAAAVARAESLLPRVRSHAVAGHHDLHAQHPAAVAALLAGAVDDGFFA